MDRRARALTRIDDVEQHVLMRNQSAVSTPSGTTTSGKSDRLGAQAWIQAAREALISGGVARVKIVPLADALGVTSGSFYWHFKDRPALLDALLDDWKANNSRAMFAAVASETDPKHQLDMLVRVWVEERDYSSAYDSAVRDWTRSAPNVASVVREVDDQRIKLIQGIFERLGQPKLEAFIRARITYFHQVGYYAMHIEETVERRLELLGIYTALLSGIR